MEHETVQGNSDTIKKLDRKTIQLLTAGIGSVVEIAFYVASVAKAESNTGMYAVAAMHALLSISLLRETRFRHQEVQEVLTEQERAQTDAAIQALAQVPHLSLEVDHTPWMPPQPQEFVLATSDAEQ